MVFAHIKNLSEIFPRRIFGFPRCCGKRAPRPVEGSYMPVFAVSESYGKAVARSCGAAFYPLTHQHGHIGAALMGQKMEGTFLALHVSGGTTDLLQVTVEEGIIKRNSGAGRHTGYCSRPADRPCGTSPLPALPFRPEIDRAGAGGRGEGNPLLCKGAFCKLFWCGNSCEALLQQGMPAEGCGGICAKMHR